MAAIAPTITEVDRSGDQSVYLVQWTLATGDTANPVSFPKHNDVSIQAEGAVFGGGTVHCLGSNDGTNYEQLRGPDSVAIALTAGGLKAVLEHTLFVKPDLTGSTGASVTITMLFHFANPNRT